MDYLSKLEAVLSEMEQERARMDVAISKVRSAIADIRGPTQAEKVASFNTGLMRPIQQDMMPPPEGGYAAAAYAILKHRGQPMHIQELIPLIAQLRSIDPDEIKRASVESSILKATEAGPWVGKLLKTAPATYAAA